LEGLQARSAIPTALMSNGSLFFMPEVRAAAARASIVKVSLSGWDETSWRCVNRPHPALRFERVLEGLRAFASGYAGTLWVEVFVVRGVNDSPEQAARLAALVNPLRPARVHLNTAVRPPADPDVRAVEGEAMRALAGLFRPPAELPEAPEPRAAPAGAVSGGLLETVLRHPATLEQLAVSLNREICGLAEELRVLERAGRVERCGTAGAVYYRGTVSPSAD